MQTQLIGEDFPLIIIFCIFTCDPTTSAGAFLDVHYLRRFALFGTIYTV